MSDIRHFFNSEQPAKRPRVSLPPVADRSMPHSMLSWNVNSLMKRNEDRQSQTYLAEEKIEIPDEVVRKTKVKIQVVDGLDGIWTSEGTGARAKVGFWRPHTKVSARKANSK